MPRPLEAGDVLASCGDTPFWFALHRWWDSSGPAQGVVELEEGGACQAQLGISGPTVDLHGLVYLFLSWNIESSPLLGESVGVIIADAISLGDDAAGNHSVRCM